MKYRYEVVTFNAYEGGTPIQEFINNYAREGWRVVSVSHPPNLVGSWVVLERPVETT